MTKIELQAIEEVLQKMIDDLEVRLHAIYCMANDCGLESGSMQKALADIINIVDKGLTERWRGEGRIINRKIPSDVNHRFANKIVDFKKRYNP